MDDDITAGTVDEVLARVGADADLAAAALEVEQGKGDAARSTLTEALERIAAQDQDDDEEPDEDEVGPRVFTAPGAADTSSVKRDRPGKVGPTAFRIQRGG